MSENSKPTLLNKLKQAQSKLEQANIATARLDTLVLAEFILNKNRAWILANPNFEVNAKMSQKFDELIKLRSHNIPIAYLTGKKEFYGRDFIVTPDVLIPRPETEMLIEIAKKTLKTGILLDVGTGSGAIAVTLACETALRIEACDISEAALEIAQKNSKLISEQTDQENTHQHEIKFFKSDLLSNTNRTYDMIIANLPYVDKSWQTSPETDFEPQSALFADDFGLKLIKKLLDQAPTRLSKSGYVLLEADPRQHKLISKYSDKFRTLEQKDFALLLQKI
ncbi:MAG TPA: peptide chain release factor N(5)-glutamine methyltransferase [Candidatus Saccharimonadales bacterium]|nr:peptide chain release factor N(5)-glutamine methyltransferase [Candidatus Saccharimonadales bacterium]